VVFATPMGEIVDGVRLTAPVHTWDGYGEAVDVRGDILVIGAPDRNQFRSGSAYVYRFLGGAWQPEAQLMASDRDAYIQQANDGVGQAFGSSVALGEGIIIGHPALSIRRLKVSARSTSLNMMARAEWKQQLTPAFGSGH
jgi:hypothetical protein